MLCSPAAALADGYTVGAATRDITPAGDVNFGGFGLGDGSVLPEDLIGSGDRGHAQGQRIAVRAMVIRDGHQAIALASVETQGMFAAYKEGPYGLIDIANQVAADIPGLPANHIIISSDHTHSGPDTIGAWGGVPDSYLRHIHDQAVAAIETAYLGRRKATLRIGRSDARDLIYNQACTEALNQNPTPSYPGPDVCPVPGTDGFFRVIQAKDRKTHVVIGTLADYAAHGTVGGANGLHGDWGQFLSDAMSKRYGGVGIGMVGALGGTQPCRPTCSFTKKSNPGYSVKDRRTAIVLNYMAHVRDSVAHSRPVYGDVEGTQRLIREPITGPLVFGLFTLGGQVGAPMMRATTFPWTTATTIRTPVTVLRVGNVVFDGTPGEGFPSIGEGVRKAVTNEQEVMQIGLANDQLGYLIAPATYVPVIAAEADFNDDILFNV
ncbi:MAG: hypothetical protein QOD39_1411, partial [Mycobacterium sp.]|nr:hypothetical protein [Mycobacterium sp.]